MAVGLDLPWPNAEYVPITSKRSLLDGDVIIIHPVLDQFYSSENYQGKPSYDDDASFRIKECISHWRNQISAALSAGKTVIVFLVEQEQFFIATGTKDYSGTGRNQRITRHVDLKDNYSLIPISLKNFANATGSRIKKEKKIWPIERYWQIMEELSLYKVTYQVENSTPLLRTIDGSQVVSSFGRSNGFLVFVPDFIFPENAVEEFGDDEKWTDEAHAFAGRLEAALFALDADCRDASIAAEAPDWVATDRHRLSAESQFEDNIRKISEQLSSLQEDHQKSDEELRSYAAVKSLLFEKGRALEDAVILALKELGFETQRHDDGESEFDVIFSADGFRYLGEVEGKDDKAINVDKSSQLERNIQEDYQRDEITEYADGVLFGNPFRLTIPNERKQPFTDKVLKAAERTGIRLITTADLFDVIQEYRKTQDVSFAAAVRRAIHDQAGKVVDFRFARKSDT